MEEWIAKQYEANLAQLNTRIAGEMRNMYSYGVSAGISQERARIRKLLTEYAADSLVAKLLAEKLKPE